MKILSRYPRVGPKLGAFFLAFFLWLYVGLNKTVTADINVNINYKGIKQGKIISNRIPEHVTVSVTTKGINMLWMYWFWQSDIQFELDLSTINYFYDFPIREERYLDGINVPPTFDEEIVINNIVAPDTIKVELDDLLSQKMPVSPENITISTRNGYWQIGNIVFEPDSVEIVGPREFIRNMTAVKTVPVSYDNVRRDISEDAELEYNEDIQYTLSTTKVRFFADIQEIGQLEVPNVPVHVQRKPGSIDVEVKPSVVSVTVTGGIDDIKDITAQDINAVIMYNRNWRRGGEYIVDVGVTVPDNILDFEISPKSIRIEVK